MVEISIQAGQMLLARLDELSQLAVDAQYEHQSAFWKPYDPEGYAKSIRDAGYHFSYLAEALAANDQTLFMDYAAWVKVLFAGLNFPEHILPTTFRFMKQAIEKTLPSDLAAVANGSIDLALDHITSSSESPAPFIQPDTPFSELANRYLKTILNNDRHAASEMILDAAAQGVQIFA